MHLWQTLCSAFQYGLELGHREQDLLSEFHIGRSGGHMLATSLLSADYDYGDVRFGELLELETGVMWIVLLMHLQVLWSITWF